MQFAVSYQPEYEYDLLIHRRKMIAIYQTRICIFKLYFIGKVLVISTQNTQGGTFNGSNLTNNSHIWSFSKALSGNGFEIVIISRGFLGFQFTLGIILSFEHSLIRVLLPNGLSYQLSCWTLVGPAYVRKNVLTRSYFCMGRKSF